MADMLPCGRGFFGRPPAWSGLPTVRYAPFDETTAATYERFTAERVDGAETVESLEPPAPLIAYLRWLAENRDILFHGPKRGGLAELRTARESVDISEFGNQQTVFASDIPCGRCSSRSWSAVRTSGPPATVRCTSETLDARRYYLSVNEKVDAAR